MQKGCLRWVKWLLFIAFSAILTSCSTTHSVGYSHDKLNSYLGYTHQNLVWELGAPTDQVSDGGDGYILVYEGNKEIFDFSPEYAKKSSTLPKAEFYMDSDGICQNVRVNNVNDVKVTNVGGTIALVIVLLVLGII